MASPQGTPLGGMERVADAVQVDQCNAHVRAGEATAHAQIAGGWATAPRSAFPSCAPSSAR
jgi:hypothetical protein